MLFQEAFGKYADKLLHKYPEQISAVYLDGEFSSQKGFVKFNIYMNTPAGTRYIKDLASATNNSAQNGDSGGGWSYNTIAWGVQSGHSGTTSYFTPIEVALDRLSAELF